MRKALRSFQPLKWLLLNCFFKLLFKAITKEKRHGQLGSNEDLVNTLTDKKHVREHLTNPTYTNQLGRATCILNY